MFEYSNLGVFPGAEVARPLRLDHTDPRRTNASDEPEAVQPRPEHSLRVEGGCLDLRLSPVPWTAVALTVPRP